MWSPSRSVWGTAAARTVSVAAVVVAVPYALVKTARYFLPLSDVIAPNDRTGPVAPLMLVKVDPPFALTCHCAVGAGVPLAEAWKVAVPLGATNWSDGLSVTAGGAVSGGGGVGNTSRMRLEC